MFWATRDALVINGSYPGFFTSSSEKYAHQNGFIFPKFRGENQKCLKPPPRYSCGTFLHFFGAVFTSSCSCRKHRRAAAERWKWRQPWQGANKWWLTDVISSEPILLTWSTNFLGAPSEICFFEGGWPAPFYGANLGKDGSFGLLTQTMWPSIRIWRCRRLVDSPFSTPAKHMNKHEPASI